MQDRQCSKRGLSRKAGFVLIGRADPADLGGKPGSWYARQIAPHPSPQGMIGVRGIRILASFWKAMSAVRLDHSISRDR